MTANISDIMPFSKLMGVTVELAERDRVVATLLVRPDLCTAGRILHGGAVMAFADALGAIGGSLNLPENAKGTTTIESKCNFLGAAQEGESVQGEATPLKVGKRLSVWQTRISRSGGELLAVVTQTQLVL